MSLEDPDGWTGGLGRPREDSEGWTGGPSRPRADSEGWTGGPDRPWADPEGQTGGPDPWKITSGNRFPYKSYDTLKSCWCFLSRPDSNSSACVRSSVSQLLLIGADPITQLRTCVMKIVHSQGRSPNLVKVIFHNIRN